MAAKKVDWMDEKTAFSKVGLTVAWMALARAEKWVGLKDSSAVVAMVVGKVVEMGTGKVVLTVVVKGVLMAAWKAEKKVEQMD